MLKLIILNLLLLSSFANTQIDIQMAGVQSVFPNFFGSNYTVSNINYIGSSESKGYFTVSNNSISINEGFVMSTGRALDVEGPNNTTNSGFDLNLPGDPMLDQLVTEPSYDAAILTFDFIPHTDTFEIYYSFGSEEYPEFSLAEFSDICAIYIAGPNMPLHNIAILPDSSNVSVSTINNGETNTGPCNNCSYYVDNGNGATPPFNQSEAYLQLDGLTTRLRAFEDSLIIGGLYTIRISIADVADGIYDSAIFIEKCENCDFADINPNSSNDFVNIYPNPSNKGFNIEVKNGSEGVLNVYDIFGRLILTDVVLPDSEVHQIPHLNVGTYIINYSDGINNWNQKIISE